MRAARARAMAMGVGLLAAAASASCKRKDGAPEPPPRPVLGEVSVSQAIREDDTLIDKETFARESRRQLLASGLFAGDPPSGDAGASALARVRIQVNVGSTEVGAKGVTRAIVGLRIDTRPGYAPGAIEEALQGEGERPYAVPAPGGRAAVELALAQRVLGDLVAGLAARRKLQYGPPEAVHAALSADAGELREEAIRAAGQRQLRAEVPRLLQLLNDPEETTRDAALGALIAMRERRAVSELTRSRSLRDRREMRKILGAISVLGGQEAEEYLSFVAETHDDEDIRAEALAAKQRLERGPGDARNRP